MELIRLYSDIPEFRQRLHREVIDETYPKLHELLRPLSQEDIDTALCAWNGNIESKHAVVRYMKDHAREKDTAAWLAQDVYKRQPSLPHSHPCYGCGNYGSPCVGICHREMERWLKERKRKK